MCIRDRVGIVAQPHTMANCAAGKTEMEGRVGFMFGPLVKRLCTIPWCLTGVAAIVYFAGTGIEPDKVFGAVAGDFLPKIMPGILGVFIAAILASVMSTCDAQMICASALFTENIYKYFKVGKDRKHYILVGRVASVVIVAGSVVYAYWLSGVIQGLEIFWKITPIMGIVFWLGLFWRRTTVAGAWAAALAAMLLWWLTSQPFFICAVGNLPAAEQLRFVVEKEAGAEIYLPWQMVFYLTAGFLAGIIVSLLTKPVNKEKLDNFYALLRAPIKPGEQVLTPCSLPEGATVLPKRNIFPNTNLEIPIPSLTAVFGFLLGWACVATIILIVFWIASA